MPTDLAWAGPWHWASTAEELIESQQALATAADAALSSEPWRWTQEDVARAPLMGGCFVTFERTPAVRGTSETRAWASAVVWRPTTTSGEGGRRGQRRDQMLIGSGPIGPRRANDVEDQAVIAGVASFAYQPGLLALRCGSLLEAAVDALELHPQVLLVDATGRDHPRSAGLALHLGAVTRVPTVGVTHRPLVAKGSLPAANRGATSPLYIDDTEVARWVRTRSGSRPVVAHAGWRTSPASAAALVLMASTGRDRTPVPLGEARRVAREARSIAEGRFRPSRRGTSGPSGSSPG